MIFASTMLVESGSLEYIPLGVNWFYVHKGRGGGGHRNIVNANRSSFVPMGNQGNALTSPSWTRTFDCHSPRYRVHRNHITLPSNTIIEKWRLRSASSLVLTRVPRQNANWLFLSCLVEVKSVDREPVHNGSKQNIEVHEYRFTRRILFTSLNKVKSNSTEVSSFLVLIQAKNLISPRASIITYISYKKPWERYYIGIKFLILKYGIKRIYMYIVFIWYLILKI